jgi:lysine N6-hydroxylase
MTQAEPYDLLGVGIGPFNLSLAALADGVPDLRCLFVEQRARFEWHPGLLLDGAMLQVSFLADLVSLVDPTSPWSFLAYLRAHDRLLPFYLKERWRPSRREYDDYCRWVASSLTSCRFDTTVTDVSWDDAAGAFAVSFTDGEPPVRARNVVLGIGTAPTVPDAFAGLVGKQVFHAADYLERRDGLAGAGDVTVIGSGQSGAEVFLDLLRSRREHGWALRWLTRSPAFAPMEQSPLGLEHFTPDYTRYFRSLDQDTRHRLLPAQWQLYKAISPETIADIYDALYEERVLGDAPPVTLAPGVAVTAASSIGEQVELRCHEALLDRDVRVCTDRVVLATGYAPRRPAFLAGLGDAVRWDGNRPADVDDDYRVPLDPAVSGGLFVQNAEHHRNGVGTPDLGLGAHRSAVILNAVAGRPVHRLASTSAFTTFGAP